MERRQWGVRGKGLSRLFGPGEVENMGEIMREGGMKLDRRLRVELTGGTHLSA
jgi:hypothetical protein